MTTHFRALVTRVALALSLGLPCAAHARQATAPQAASLDRPLRLFIDCRSGGCDQEFFRRELTWIDHVRDQKDADVHLLITSQGTGGGGTEYQLRFIGHGQWEGQEDQLRLSVEAGDTDDQRRRALLQMFALGLARFAAATPVGRGLKVTAPAAAPGAASAQSTVTEDPWNFWVFRTNLNAFLDGEASSSFANLNANQQANRTTDAWKININTGISYNESRYDLEEEEGEFISTRKGWNVNGLVVKSLTDRWSIATRGGVSRSTFLNQKLAARAAAGVEFNFFPYKESSQRSWIFQWTAGPALFKYDTVTIYDKLQENKWAQLSLSELNLRQPFGEVGLSLEYFSYLDDPSFYRFSIEADTDIRVTRGLSIRLNGNYQLIHDQLYLKRGEATNEEIIARQQQLQTSFRYFISVGLTYRFGSINNNVVNPRFNNGGF